MKVGSPSHKPTQKEAAGVCWCQKCRELGFTCWVGGWETASSTGSRDWNQMSQKVGSCKVTAPVEWKAGESHLPSKGCGHWSEWLSAPCGEQASASENLRPQPWPHAGLGLNSPARSGKPKVEKLAQSRSQVFAPKAPHKGRYKSSLEIASYPWGPSIPRDEDLSNSSWWWNITWHRDEIHHENQEKRKRKPELDPQGPQMLQLSDTGYKISALKMFTEISRNGK